MTNSSACPGLTKRLNVCGLLRDGHLTRHDHHELPSEHGIREYVYVLNYLAERVFSCPLPLYKLIKAPPEFALAEKAARLLRNPHSVNQNRI